MSKRLTVLLVGAACILAAKLAMTNVVAIEPLYVSSDVVGAMDAVILPRDLVGAYPNESATVRDYRRLPKPVSITTPLRMWVVAAMTTVTKGTARSAHANTTTCMHFG